MSASQVSEVKVTGTLVGCQLDPVLHSITGQIVHIDEDLPGGPAENAFIFVELGTDGVRMGRYIAWINLYDIEHAALVNPGCWQLIEPAQHYDETILWRPYGWGGQKLPSVADVSFY